METKGRQPAEKPRILIVSVYSIAQPRYGGPRRSRAIFDALRDLGGAVEYVAVHPRNTGIKAGPNDVAVSRDTQERVDLRPYLADVICGEAIYSDRAVRRHMTQLLRKFHPDVIFIEQIYPFFGLKPLLADLDSRPQLVFSSQNIEHEMKPSMYEHFNAEPDVARQVTQRIEQAEQELARESAFVVAVSSQDLEKLHHMGARRAVLAPNGTSPLRASPSAVERHKRFLVERGIRRSAAFVSSAHQPNWQGFVDMVGTRMGFLRPGVALLLCGSVCDLIGPRVATKDVEDVTFWQRVIKMGTLPDDELAAVILSAGTILLPITQGGGSNLKTAEALASGRPIVGTSFAFRGYEEFLHFPGVRIADNPGPFRAAIGESLDASSQARSYEQTAMVRSLMWDRRLTGLVEEVQRL